MGKFMTVTFDHLDPASEKARVRDGVRRQSLGGLDYSPLPRLTGRSLALGALVSMGGLM
jgi:SP family sugar:H+ symporter-like MFS transporter